jgi:hypothetical protein
VFHKEFLPARKSVKSEFWIVGKVIEVDFVREATILIERQWFYFV